MLSRFACLATVFCCACSAPTPVPVPPPVAAASSSDSIDGNWILVVNEEYGKKVIPYRHPSQIKTFRDGYFTLFMYDSAGQFKYAGAGPFSLDGDRYFETFEYASVPGNVGASDWQRWKLVGDAGNK